MKYNLLLVAFVVSTATGAMAQAGSLNCSAPELLGDPRYDQLVCVGIEKMAAGDFEAAIDSFEHALQLRLFEVPNSLLFPRLALAYWKAGRVQEARETIEKARLSVEILAGVTRCVETDSGWVIVDHWLEPIDSPYVLEIRDRMCGAALEYFYRQERLENFVIDAELVKLYLAAREVITPD